MRESRNSGQLEQYLEANRITHVFNEELKPHLSLYSFSQGELICKQGEPPEWMYVLVKGKIKIYTTSAEGRTLILSFKKPLEVIGDIEFVQGIDILNTVEAITPVTMIGVPFRSLHRHGREDASLMRFLLEILTQKFLVKSTSLSFNLMHPVEVRLASYLLSVTYDDTDSLFRGQVSTVKLVDIANLIGTSYRHLNRIIRQFCTEGLIERDRGYIRIKNQEGLRAIAGHNIYE